MGLEKVRAEEGNSGFRNATNLSLIFKNCNLMNLYASSLLAIKSIPKLKAKNRNWCT